MINKLKMDNTVKMREKIFIRIKNIIENMFNLNTILFFSIFSLDGKHHNMNIYSSFLSWFYFF